MTCRGHDGGIHGDEPAVPGAAGVILLAGLGSPTAPATPSLRPFASTTVARVPGRMKVASSSPSPGVVMNRRPPRRRFLRAKPALRRRAVARLDPQPRPDESSRARAPPGDSRAMSAANKPGCAARSPTRSMPSAPLTVFCASMRPGAPVRRNRSPASRRAVPAVRSTRSKRSFSGSGSRARRRNAGRRLPGKETGIAPWSPPEARGMAAFARQGLRIRRHIPILAVAVEQRLAMKGETRRGLPDPARRARRPSTSRNTR